MRVKHKILSLIVTVVLSVCLLVPAQEIKGEEISISSPSVILMEASTGQVIYESNADEQFRPASVTKVMTLLLTFEEIGAGRLSLTDTVTISEYAASMEGSRCFFEAGEQQSVEDMIKCIIIASGNDTAVAIGEHIAGSEEAFVNMMNEKAKELGMVNTNFENACGLDADGHLTTSRDIAIMTRELITKYPAIFDYSTIWMDSIIHTTRRGSEEFTLANTNKFLREYNGATGLKTGYTSQAKYSISATATRDNVDLIAVVMGAETKELRNDDAAKLMDYGFAKCQMYSDITSLSDIGDIAIAGGTSSVIKCKELETFSYVFTQGEDMSKVTKKIVTLENRAPIAKGDVVGQVEYSYNGTSIGKVDIVAAEAVDAIDFKICFVRVLFRFMNA